MSKTAHSEYRALKTVFLKSIETGFKHQNYIAQHWKSLNYLEQPDYEKAIAEYIDFTKLIQESGAELRFFEETDQTGMDSIYCRDASIATDHGMIICNMGKAQRDAEPMAQKAFFEKQGIPVLGVIEAPGLLEGGDVAWLDENTLAVAHGYRTNQEGFDQLKALLEPHNIQLVQVPLPHYKGPSDVFHLMSIFSPIDLNLAVVYSPLMPVFFRTMLLDHGYDLVEVPEEEFESMGCNVLALSPRQCIMVSGNPITESRIASAGAKVTTYQGDHISVFGGGGPTCLTRPISRI